MDLAVIPIHLVILQIQRGALSTPYISPNTLALITRNNPSERS